LRQGAFVRFVGFVSAGDTASDDVGVLSKSFLRVLRGLRVPALGADLVAASRDPVWRRDGCRRHTWLRLCRAGPFALFVSPALGAALVSVI
jgi:hypothetical protein